MNVGQVESESDLSALRKVWIETKRDATGRSVDPSRFNQVNQNLFEALERAWEETKETKDTISAGSKPSCVAMLAIRLRKNENLQRLKLTISDWVWVAVTTLLARHIIDEREAKLAEEGYETCTTDSVTDYREGTPMGCNETPIQHPCRADLNFVIILTILTGIFAAGWMFFMNRAAVNFRSLNNQSTWMEAEVACQAYIAKYGWVGYRIDDARKMVSELAMRIAQAKAAWEKAENECAQSSATLLIRHGILADYDKEFGKSGYKLPEIQGLLAKTGQELRQAEIAFNKANNIDEATTASDGDKLSAWEDYITVFGATGFKMEESRQKVDVFRAKLVPAKAAHQYMKSTIDSTTQPVSSKIDALKHYLDNYSSAGYRVTESKNLLAERIAEQEKTLNNAKAAFNHAKALENSTTATDEDKLSAWVDYLTEHRDSDYKLDAAHKSQELHASRIAAAKLAYDHILGADETRTSPSLKILDAWRNYFKFHKDTGYMVAWVKQRIEDLQHDVDNFKTALNECEEADRSTTATLQQKLEQWKNLQSKFPNDVIITQAPSRINSLRKQLDAYQNASSIDDSSTASNDMKIKTWEKYLQNYPQSGLNIAEVETRLAKLPFVEPGGGISLEMVFAPGGTLRSGTDTHTITGFWVGKLEVTQRQYEKIMSVNPSYFKNPDNPVEKTDWTDATKFCEKLSHISGRRYTLPSEAQWEYACRAGSKGRFCFGDNPSALGDYCWFKDNAQGATHPAGAKKPNSWGIHDMHGNVWEWCDTITPTGLRVLRGGCWFDNANDCVATIREVHPLSTVNHGVGFRVVMNIENIE